MKKLLGAQTLILLAGTLFAWSRLIPQLRNFRSEYGTLLRFTDCVIPNPLKTACFFGSLAFLVALIWSLALLNTPGSVGERRLFWFLVACVLFAASVVVVEFSEYYHWFGVSSFTVSCSPGTFPLQTPCFLGLIFFVLALGVANIINRINRRSRTM